MKTMLFMVLQIDLDNQRMYGHFNGTWLHSGNPSAGTNGTGVSSFYTVGDYFVSIIYCS